MHQVARQIIAFYTLISGPALSEAERADRRIAEAVPCAGACSAIHPGNRFRQALPKS